MMKNKKLEMPIIILIVVIVAVVMTTIIMNTGKPNSVPNLNPVDEESASEIEDENNNAENTTMNKMFATINGEKLEIQLEDNPTTAAFLKMLPLEVTMSDLNRNEKYVYLDESLPTNAYNPGSIEAGDVMLYGDDCLVIFYESFDAEYSYTKIGYIDGLPELGDDNVVVEFSVE